MENMDVDSSVAALRALLTEDFSTYKRLHAELDTDQRRVFAVVLSAAFNEAAVRQFGKHYTRADVIEFVADARARYAGEPVGAEDAETVIRVALGEEHLLGKLNGYASGAAQTAMLFALTHESDASRDGVEALLADAVEQAAAYLRRRASR